MKILLTGGEGFIGRNFYRLYKDKYDIVHNQSDIRFVNFSGDYQFIIHLAAYAGVRRSHEIPDEYWDNNVNGSENVFQFAEKNNIPVIYASSSSIYEWWLSPYATTKKVVEEIAPKNSLGLRFHTVYGLDSRPDMLYDRLLNRDVSYLTNHLRDWTHVDDVCDAISLCVENYHSIENKCIDVGLGSPVAVKDMAEKIWPGNKLPLRDVDGERKETCADPSVLLQLGWDPKYHILRDDV